MSEPAKSQQECKCEDKLTDYHLTNCLQTRKLQREEIEEIKDIGPDAYIAHTIMTTKINELVRAFNNQK